jgi:PAS domain S-box-containing protein
MSQDRNLLFAMLCLQTGRIDSDQFADACRACMERPSHDIGELFVERGWIQPEDRPHINYFVNRGEREQLGDTKAAIEVFLSRASRSRAGLESLVAENTVAYSGNATEGKVITAPSAPSVAAERYGYTSLHASGGMGHVWLARDHQLDRDVALKQLRIELTRNTRMTARFIREARLTGQLEHPGIAPVYELLTDTGAAEPFYTMRFVRGRTLTEALREYHTKRRAGTAGPLELVSLLSAFVSVCHTLAYAHSRQVIHRDLKGDNVILGDFGEVVVLDWGVAKRLGQHESEDGQLPGDQGMMLDDAGLTIQGDVVGTPAYMSPEQAEGRLEEMDERTDVYGLGAILYELLTGRPPFVGSTTLEVLEKAIRGVPTPPHELWPEVPPALEEICLKAMAKSPLDRFARAEEVAQAVQQWQEVQRRRAEDALRRQTEVLRSILNSMSEGVVVADGAGKILLANPAAERMLGNPQDEALTSTKRIFRPDLVTPFDANVLPLARAIRGEEINDEEMFIAQAGESEGIWASANARPLFDEAGELQGGLVVFRDITERKRVEAELYSSRERFELAVRGSQDGLWDWEPHTGKIFYSPRWKSIIGYEDHEISHRIEEWEKRLHPEDRERVLAVNQAHIEGVTPHYECEYRLRHKDGSYRWILARGVALRDSAGNTYRVAGSHVDITERKATEEELARLLLREKENEPEVRKNSTTKLA